RRTSPAKNARPALRATHPWCRMSVFGCIAAIGIVIRVLVAAPVIIIAGPETPTPVAAEVAVHSGIRMTDKAPAESPTGTGETATAKVAAAEATAHVATSAESTRVSTTTTTTGECVSAHSRGKRGSRSQNDHSLP